MKGGVSPKKAEDRPHNKQVSVITSTHKIKLKSTLKNKSYTRSSAISSGDRCWKMIEPAMWCQGGSPQLPSGAK